MNIAGSWLNFCAHCGKPANHACAQCRDTFYCSREHQVLSWKDHRPVCKYYKCIQEPSKKSYLVATRNIPKGKIVMCSKPVAVGPSGTEPVCLGCLRPTIYDVMSFQCEVCGWPICNLECQKAEMHQAECDAMKKKKFRLEQEQLSRRKWHETFQILPGPWLLALRVLLSNEKSRLSKFYREDDHEKKLPSSKLLENSHAINAYDFIKRFLKQTQFDADEIAFVTRVMTQCMLPVQTLKDHNNIFEPRYASGVHASDIVYLQHSCLPNMQLIETVDEPLFTKVVSLKEIRAGEILTVNKSNCSPMLPTLQRQEAIKASNAILQFDGLCACLRCKSPSELNLHCGSLLCKSCGGMVVPLSTSDILNSDWACEGQGCGFKVNRTDQSKIVNDLSNEFKQICSEYDGDLLLQNVVKFVENNSGSSGALNQQHFLIFLAKDKFCHEIFTQSSDKGASYKFDQKKLSRFFKYTSNLEDDLKLQNIDLSFVFIRGILVHSRSVVHKWVRKELSTKKAKAQLKMICQQLQAKFQSNPIRDRNTQVCFNNANNELGMHFQRLEIAS